jgi:hypothetical protein
MLRLDTQHGMAIMHRSRVGLSYNSLVRRMGLVVVVEVGMCGVRQKDHLLLKRLNEKFDYFLS